MPGANGPHAASAQRSRSRSPLRLGALRRSPHLHTAKRNRAQCDCGLRLQPAFLAPLSGTSAPAALGQSPCSPWPQSAVATPPAPRVRWPGAGPPRAAIAGCTLHSYLTGSTGHAPHSCAARCLHVVGFAANEPMCRSQWRAKMSGRVLGAGGAQERVSVRRGAHTQIGARRTRKLDGLRCRRGGRQGVFEGQTSDGDEPGDQARLPHSGRNRARPRADSSPPTAIWSVPGEITAFLSDLWTDTHVAGVVRSPVWPAYSGVAVRSHGHRSVAARRLPLTACRSGGSHGG